jgi:hypothetical protein
MPRITFGKLQFFSLSLNKGQTQNDLARVPWIFVNQRRLFARQQRQGFQFDL